MCNVFPASAVCRPRQVLAWDFDLLPNDEILPIEFSRCLKLADAAAGTPGLFRADLLLTGVCSNGSSTPDFPFTTDHFTTRVAASTIWHTAIAWPCATHSRTVPPSEFSARASNAPLDIGAASVQKKGRLVSLTASGRGSA